MVIAAAFIAYLVALICFETVGERVATNTPGSLRWGVMGVVSLAIGIWLSRLV